MGIYQKKPLEIEAFQWDGTESDGKRIEQWSKGKARYRDSIGDDTWTKSAAHLIVATTEGNMQGLPGDWIIKGIKGEFYPCADDVFRETYKLIES